MFIFIILLFTAAANAGECKITNETDLSWHLGILYKKPNTISSWPLLDSIINYITNNKSLSSEIESIDIHKRETKQLPPLLVGIYLAAHTSPAPAVVREQDFSPHARITIKPSQTSKTMPFAIYVNDETEEIALNKNRLQAQFTFDC